MKKVLYTLKDGTLVDREAIERAFHIITGKMAWKDEGAFLKFLWNRFGKSIKSYKAYSVGDLIKIGDKLHAIKLYRDQFNCTVADAHAMITDIMNAKEVYHGT